MRLADQPAGTSTFTAKAPAPRAVATTVDGAVPCVVAALAGSSRHVLTGPTNTLSLAMAASLAPLAALGSAEYLRLALVVTLFVGVVQVGVAVLG